MAIFLKFLKKFYQILSNIFWRTILQKILLIFFTLKWQIFNRVTNLKLFQFDNIHLTRHNDLSTNWAQYQKKIYIFIKRGKLIFHNLKLDVDIAFKTLTCDAEMHDQTGKFQCTCQKVHSE